MFAYIVLIAVPALFAFGSGDRRAVRFAVIASCVVIGWLAGFRLNVGMDWNNYLAIWRAAEGLNYNEIVEQRGDPGWSLLLYIGHQFNLGLTGINIIGGVVFAYGFYQLLKECDEPMIGVLAALPILVLTLPMSAVRQSFAIALEMIVLANWFRWRLPLKAIVLAAAASFHFSAAALLLLLLFSKKFKASHQRVLAVSGGLAFLVFLALSSRFEQYSTTYTSTSEAVESSGIYFHLAFLIFPFLYYVLNRKTWIERFKSVEFLDVMGVGLVLCVIAAPISSTAADRMSLYFWPGAIIIYASIPAMMRTERTRLVVRVGAVVLSFVTTLGWLTVSNSQRAYVPYQSIFISPDDRVRGNGPLE